MTELVFDGTAVRASCQQVVSNDPARRLASCYSALSRMLAEQGRCGAE
jgi:hypothetical protein